jgi:glycosyltransferase involved in cell wall biosynthesis
LGKILFLSQLLPYPPDAGPKVRSYYVLRHLAQNRHVTLLAFTRPDDPPMAVDHLKGICEEVQVVPIQRSCLRDVQSMATSLLGGKSFVIERDFFPKIAQKVDRLMAAKVFDAVHADQLWMAQYAIRARSRSAGVKLVLDEHNACYQVFQRLAQSETNPFKRWFYQREARALQSYEAWAVAQFNQVVTVTREDQAILQSMLADSSEKDHLVEFATIPICVDTQEIQPVKPTTDSYNVLNLGTMFYLPNVTGMLWFARDVWPRILAQVPQATLTIAGKNPPAEIQAITTSKNGGANIQVTGYVPDPRPYLEQAGVFIVPLLAGGGMRVKIVEAWRWGLPIVSTSTGAEGIDYRDGENILIADGAEAFANAVLRVLCEPELAKSLRVNGRRWVEQRYDWRQVYSAWDAIYPPISI